MRLGGEDRVDVGLAESFVVHATEEETDGRGTAPRVRRPSTMTESELPLAENLESNVRMAHSFGVSVLGFVTVVVVTGVEINVVGTADGQAGGVTALDHHKARV